MRIFAGHWVQLLCLATPNVMKFRATWLDWQLCGVVHPGVSRRRILQKVFLLTLSIRARRRDRRAVISARRAAPNGNLDNSLIRRERLAQASCPCTAPKRGRGCRKAGRIDDDAGESRYS